MVSTEDWNIFNVVGVRLPPLFPVVSSCQAAQNYDVDAFLDAKAKKAVLALQLGGLLSGPGIVQVRQNQ